MALSNYSELQSSVANWLNRSDLTTEITGDFIVLTEKDFNSKLRIRKMVESDSSFSILTGHPNGKYLVSSFIKGSELPRVGDLLVTSGNAKIFPRDILVAKVIDIKDDYYIAIPYVDFNNLNYVQVVKSK